MEAIRRRLFIKYLLLSLFYLTLATLHPTYGRSVGQIENGGIRLFGKGFYLCGTWLGCRPENGTELENVGETYTVRPIHLFPGLPFIG
jgi:hypothetical protein